uniref:Variant surface glycoprotein 1125.1005 n=1 Tax=Trypanosoma brucei TaxID=5691 RepID=A0A1J0R6A9_9TRYP|nr:variant surface glycoprotein 1125.1005 [Trypanosoma brucei]
MLLELSIAIFFAVTSADADGENTREFGDMCKLYNLLTAGISIPHPQQDITDTGKKQAKMLVTTVKTDIQKLNLTVADGQVLAALKDEATYPTVDKAKDGSTKILYFDKITEEDFQTMRAAYKELEGTSKEQQEFRARYKLPLAETTKRRLAPAIASLFDAAKKLLDNAKSAQKQAETAAAASRRHMIAALYGEKYATAESEKGDISTAFESKTTADNFPWTDSQTRDTACAKPDGQPDKPGAAMAADMVCICTGMDNADHKYCGTTAATGTINMGSGSGYTAKASQIWHKLSAACKQTPSTYTPAQLASRLSHALANWQSNFGKNAVYQAAVTGAAGTPNDRLNILGAYAIGGATPPTCAASGATPLSSAGKGVCVEYTTLTASDKAIPWVVQIQDAINELEKIQQLNSYATTVLAKAGAIGKQMETVLLMGDLLTVATGTLPAITASKQPTIEEQNKCAKFNSNETECTKNDCEYNSTKKECKPKEGTENTLTATGETAKEGAGATVCAKHKDKIACENDKTGNKQNCAWRKGKDNEDDKETEK